MFAQCHCVRAFFFDFDGFLANSILLIMIHAGSSLPTSPASRLPVLLLSLQVLPRRPLKRKVAPARSLASRPRSWHVGQPFEKEAVARKVMIPVKAVMTSLEQRQQSKRASLRGQPTPSTMQASILENHAVASQADYLRRLASLVKFVEMHRLPFETDSEHELALLLFFDELYLDGGKVHEGTKLWAAFQHIYPQYGKMGALRLGRVSRALQGWNRLAPMGHRLPLPEEVVAAIVVCMMQAELPELGLLTLLAMDAYLRSGEAFNLPVMSVVAAAPEYGTGYEHTALLLAPHVLGNPTKTKEFNESVLLDTQSRPWLGPFVEALAAKRPQEEPQLVRTTYHVWERAFQAAASKAGVSILHPVLYLLRHTGASSDILKRRRRLDVVKKRGRWLSDMTVRRYEKAAQTQSRLNLLSPAAREFARYCHDHLGALVAQPHLAPAPPRG